MCGVGNRSIEGRTADIHSQRGSESAITKELEACVSIYNRVCVFGNTCTVASALCVYIVTVKYSCVCVT